MKHEYDYYYLLTTIMQYQVLMDEYSKYLIQLLMDYIYPYSFIHFDCIQIMKTFTKDHITF